MGNGTKISVALEIAVLTLLGLLFCQVYAEYIKCALCNHGCEEWDEVECVDKRSEGIFVRCYREFFKGNFSNVVKAGCMHSNPIWDKGPCTPGCKTARHRKTGEPIEACWCCEEFCNRNPPPCELRPNITDTGAGC